MPVVSLAVGGLNVSDWKYVIKDAVLNEAGEVVEAETAILYGDFIQSILDFLIVALCIFTALRILMKTKNLLNEKQLAAEEAKKKAEEGYKRTVRWSHGTHGSMGGSLLLRFLFWLHQGRIPRRMWGFYGNCGWLMSFVFL